MIDVGKKMYTFPTSRSYFSYFYSLTCLDRDRHILRDPLVRQTARVKGRRDYRTSFHMALDCWIDNSSYFFQHRTLRGNNKQHILKHILKHYLKISLYIMSLKKKFHYSICLPNRIHMIKFTAVYMNMLYSTWTYIHTHIFPICLQGCILIPSLFGIQGNLMLMLSEFTLTGIGVKRQSNTFGLELK